jgi:hypothetical protein
VLSPDLSHSFDDNERWTMVSELLNFVDALYEIEWVLSNSQLRVLLLHHTLFMTLTSNHDQDEISGYDFFMHLNECPNEVLSPYMVQLREYYQSLQRYWLALSHEGKLYIVDHDRLLHLFSTVLSSDTTLHLLDELDRNKCLRLFLYFWELSATVPYQDQSDDNAINCLIDFHAHRHIWDALVTVLHTDNSPENVLYRSRLGYTDSYHAWTLDLYHRGKELWFFPITAHWFSDVPLFSSASFQQEFPTVHDVKNFSFDVSAHVITLYTYILQFFIQFSEYQQVQRSWMSHDFFKESWYSTNLKFCIKQVIFMIDELLTYIHDDSIIQSDDTIVQGDDSIDSMGYSPHAFLLMRETNETLHSFEYLFALWKLLGYYRNELQKLIEKIS